MRKPGAARLERCRYAHGRSIYWETLTGPVEDGQGKRDLIGERTMSKAKVLFLATNPNQSGLSAEEAARQTAQKISSSASDSHRSDSLEFVSCLASRSDDLLPALMQHTPTVLHYLGDEKGSCPNDGSIVVQDDTGQLRAINENALKHIFATLRSQKLRVVILNSCHNCGTQLDAIKDTVDFTIEMRNGKKESSSKADLIFAASFYRALGMSRSLQEAFDMGKSSLLLEGIPVEETPKLYARSDGIDASGVRLVNPPPPPTNPVFGSIWNQLDEDLQDAFALAATAARREGKDYISTTQLFSALRRLSPQPLSEVFAQLPDGSLPESTPSAVAVEVVALDDIQSLSPCVTAAMENLTLSGGGGTTDSSSRPISSEDIFVDIALHGKSKSTVRLRTHGVDQAKVHEIVTQLGHTVLLRADPLLLDFKDQVREVPSSRRYP